MPEYELEPWPGYGEQNEDERITALEQSVGEARQRGDHRYALAICSAVTACETLERKGEGEPNQLERTASTLGHDVEEELKGAEGWTPK